ncbi:MAG: hypothetical protein WBB34_18025 [Xanthobacteraceae bacterium]
MRQFGLVVRPNPAFAAGVAKFFGERRRQARRLRHELVRHVLQMAFSDQGRAISVMAQKVDECHCIPVERNPVMARSIYARHPPGHENNSVGHADRAGDIEMLEPDSPRCDRVDVRGLHDAVAVAAQMIGALLVGHDHEEVGPVHGMRTLLAERR